MHFAVGVFLLYFSNKDLLSLCLIRPLWAGCTDPVSQTQLVSWIQQGCKSPNEGHSLHSASAYAVLCHCMWWQSRLSVVVPACAKRTTSLVTFQCHCTLTTAQWLGLTPHKQQCHKAPASKCSSDRKQATDIETSSLPSPCTWMARTKQVFGRCHQGTERSRGKLSSPGALRDCKEECKLSWWGEDRKSK